MTFTCTNAVDLQTTTETIYFNINFGEVTITLVGSGFIPDINTEDNYIVSDTAQNTVTAFVHAESDFKEVSQNNGMSLRNSIGSRTYLVYTQGTTDDIRDRTEHIRSGEFDKMPNPSFGFPITDKYKIYVGLEYDNIEISGSERFGEGYYDLIFRNAEDTSNKYIIDVKRK